MREGNTSKVMAADSYYGEFLQRQSGIFWINPYIMTSLVVIPCRFVGKYHLFEGAE
jgi:hypothetical protein